MMLKVVKGYQRLSKVVKGCQMLSKVEIVVKGVKGFQRL